MRNQYNYVFALINSVHLQLPSQIHLTTLIRLSQNVSLYISWTWFITQAVLKSKMAADSGKIQLGSHPKFVHHFFCVTRYQMVCFYQKMQFCLYCVQGWETSVSLCAINSLRAQIIWALRVIRCTPCNRFHDFCSVRQIRFKIRAPCGEIWATPCKSSSLRAFCINTRRYIFCSK